MRNILLLAQMLLFSIVSNAIPVKDNPIPISISLSDNIISRDYVLKKGNYELTFKDVPENVLLTIKIDKDVTQYNALSYPAAKESTSPEGIAGGETPPIEDIKFKISSNTIYSITITITYDDNRKEIRIYNFKSDSTWDWTTTFGINGIFLINSDTYKTISAEDKFKVVGDGGQNKYDYLPSVMFSFMDQSKNFQWGFSGGLGFDLEKISVFVGGSCGIGQNIIITTGLAFHQQQRLDSKYSSAEIVESSLSFDDLHEAYYRFNPFVSISFRLDNNPFSKK